MSKKTLLNTLNTLVKSNTMGILTTNPDWIDTDGKGLTIVICSKCLKESVEEFRTDIKSGYIIGVEECTTPNATCEWCE